MNKNIKLLIVLVALMAFAASIYFVKSSAGGFPNEVLDDFAIKDTASIDRIFIADARNGRTVDLKRNKEESFWTCNDNFRAKEYSVKILLECFHDIFVKGPVRESERENIIKLISTKGKKVEIYSNGELNKTYFIGTCTQDQQGTYMVLEHGDGQRSVAPLVMDKKLFKGCLRQRFFTEEEEWRYTGIYEYPNLGFKKVSLDNAENPQYSYSIGYGGGNDIKLFDGEGNDIPKFDTLAVKDYLLLFKKVHFETYESYLTPLQEDSLLKVPPVFTFNVVDNNGNEKPLYLNYMKPAKDYELPDGSFSPYDLENFYGRVGEDEIGRVQTFVFNPLLKELDYFIGK